MDRKSQESLAAQEVILVEDDILFRRALANGFARLGYEPYQASDLASAQRVLGQHPSIENAIIDLNLGDVSGLLVLQAFVAEHPHMRCIVLSGFCSAVAAVQAIRLGAVDCLPKSSSIEAVVAALHAEPAPIDAPTPSLAQVEWDHIQRVLHDVQGNVSLAARKLGIHRQSLQRKLRNYAPIK